MNTDGSPGLSAMPKQFVGLVVEEFVVPFVCKSFLNDRHQRSMIQICSEVVVNTRVICPIVNWYLDIDCGLLPPSTFKGHTPICIFRTRSKLIVDQVPARGTDIFAPELSIIDYPQ